MFTPPRLSRSNVKHVCAALSVGLLTALLITPSLADHISPSISHTDLFEGATGSTSGDLTGIAPLFGGIGGPETTHFIFNDSQAPLRFVNFDTVGGPDTVRSIRIVFANDGGNNGISNDRHALSFRLFADLDLDSTYETVAIPTTLVDFGIADIMMNLASDVTADLFRLEVDNFVGNTFNANGARIIEFDAFSTTFVTGPPPPNGVPEPSTLALLGLGLLGAAGFRRRWPA